jgi:hypothetical protein
MREDIDMSEQNAAPSTPNSGKAVAALVLGICSIVVPVWGVGLVLGVIGLVLGIAAKKENPSGMATAGFVLSIIGVVLGGITFFSCLACTSACATVPWDSYRYFR